MIVAQQQLAPQATVDALAVAFVVLRLAHGIFYLSDIGVLRSAAFLGGLGCTVAIFLAAVR